MVLHSKRSPSNSQDQEKYLEQKKLFHVVDLQHRSNILLVECQPDGYVRAVNPRSNPHATYPTRL